MTTNIEELQRTGRLYRLIVENTSDTLLVTDDAGDFVYVCPNCVVVFRRELEEIRGLGNIRALLGEDILDVDGLGDLGNEIANMERHVVDGDGRARTILVTVKHVNLEVNGGSLLFVVRDITERDQILHQKARKLRMQAIERFAAGTAHDLRNLSQIVLGRVESIRQRSDDPDIHDALGVIESALGDSATLLRELTRFSRGEQAGVGSDERVRVGAVLDGLEKSLVTAVFPAHLSVLCDDEQLEAQIPAHHLQRVLLNLALNAREASGPEGQVLIYARRQRREMPVPVACGLWMPPGEYVVIGVRDSGPGVHDEVRERAFEPYFSTREGDVGGLGLPTSLALVRRANGYMEMHSVEGGGADVRLYLPLPTP